MSEKTAKTTTAAKTADTKGEKAAEKPAAPKVEIIRGRMPLPIVHMIKFSTDGETDGAVATKFRTTNGKVSDVRKDRNFGYVVEASTFDQKMIDGAVAYAEQLDDKTILTAVKALKVDDKAADTFKDARVANKPPKKDKEEKKDAPKEKVSDKDIDSLTA